MQRAFNSILLVVFLAFSSTALAGARGDWTVVQSAGEVVILVDGYQKAAVDPRAALQEGTIIATGKSGRAVVRRGDEQIIVQPNTRLKLTNGSTATTRFMQSTGSALYRIGKKRAPHFQVDTPYLAAIVKGTIFTVTVDGEHADVSVTEGAVEVSSNAGAAVTLVKPGMSARVGQDDHRNIDLQDRSGTHRLITANEGGWGSGGMGGGSASGGGSAAPPAGSAGGSALLRTGTDQASAGAQTNLSRLRNSTIAVEVTSASDPNALRLATTPEAGDTQATTVAFEGRAPHAVGLRHSVADENETGSGSANRLQGMGHAVNDAASAMAGKVDATVRSLAHHKPLKVKASMPWTEMSMGLMALMAMMIVSHTRSLRARTKKLEALS